MHANNFWPGHFSGLDERSVPPTDPQQFQMAMICLFAPLKFLPKQIPSASRQSTLTDKWRENWWLETRNSLAVVSRISQGHVLDLFFFLGLGEIANKTQKKKKQLCSLFRVKPIMVFNEVCFARSHPPKPPPDRITLVFKP